MPDRLRMHAAWALAAAIFLSVGWTAMRPADPRGCVSLLAFDLPSIAMLQVLALAIVTSALTTVVAGRAFPDAGVFAVGVGLTLVSLRGGTMTFLIMEENGGGLCMVLAGECLYWFAVMGAAAMASAAASRWLTNGPSDDPSTPNTSLSHSAVSEIPVIGNFFAGHVAATTDWRTGLKHTLLAALGALILIRILSAGAPDRAIRHGQACFAIIAAYYLVIGPVQSRFPVRTAFWGLLAVPLAAIVAYGFAAAMSLGAPVDHLPSIPRSAFLRPLPINYMALGAASVVFWRWRLIPADRAEDRT